jgi:GT2 family glycosyltransferase
MRGQTTISDDWRLNPLSTTAPQIRHTVTAVIVAHDGAQLLPGLVQALRAQTYVIERVVGVDTGSRDRGGAVLAELIGPGAVFGMDRDTGFGEAVATALRHGSASRALPADPDMRRVEWIWLLHDDCEPAPDALERLLKAATRDRSVAILGPKVLDAADRRTLREAGVSIDHAGRRITGIEPGEIDQGQHDGNRPVLAVGSAGMLVRRDAWERLGGFDTRLTLFRDDLDFCWRAHGAGYRVQVVTDAVLYHREMSARRRRGGEGLRLRMLDRRNALYVLAVNLPLFTMLRVIAGCAAGSLIRTAWLLLTKQTELAAAQGYALLWLFGNPFRLWAGRRKRARGRREAYDAVRRFILPGRTLARLAEDIAGLLTSGPPQASGGRHQALSSSETDEEDEQFVDQQSVLRRVIGNPGVLLFAVLLLIALIAERRLLGAGPLGGGALVPAWGSSSELWSEYLAGFHATGVGSAASTPPYVAVVAALATVLGTKSWLAVSVLLLGCVPLAGVTAYTAARKVVASSVVRVLLAASYAVLPVGIGTVASGDLGTAVAFILLPLIAVSGGRMVTGSPRIARRAAWATGLLVALAAAFAPVIWLIAAAGAVAVAAAERWRWRRRSIGLGPLSLGLTDAAIAVCTPFLLLFPWSLHLFSDPSAFLTQAGVQSAGLTASGPSAPSLLLLHPGGPGLPPLWVTAGLALAVVAALLPHRRGPLVAAGWGVAATGYLFAILASRLTVTPAGGGPAATGLPGAALAVAAVGLLMAAAPAAEWLASPGRELASAGRKLLAVLVLSAAATAPVLAAFFWVTDGVQGPVAIVSQPLLPAFVAASSTSGTQYRTLVLRPSGGTASGAASDTGGGAGGGLDFAVLRQRDPILGEPELTGYGPAEQALTRDVAELAAPDGADSGDPGQSLAEFGIRWVMLPAPIDQSLVVQLNASVGLVPVSTAPSYDLWQVAGTVARLRVIGPDGTVTPVQSQAVGASGASVPASGGTLVLAEPYGGWTAALDGRALKPLPAPVGGWAQGFTLPAGGGTLTLTRDNLARQVSLVLELIAALAVCVLALPGKRPDIAEEAEALAAVRAARAARADRAAAASARAAGAGRRALLAVRPALRERPVRRARPAGPIRPVRLAKGKPGEAVAALEAGAESPQTPEDPPAGVLTEVSAGEPPSDTAPARDLTPPSDTAPARDLTPPSDTDPTRTPARDLTPPSDTDPTRTPAPAPTQAPGTAAPWEHAPPSQPARRGAATGEHAAQRPERHSHRAGRHGKPAKPGRLARPGRRRREDRDKRGDKDGEA